MAMLGFKPRSQERDQGTDRSRFHTLAAQIGSVIVDIENEMDGLQSRYRRASDNAAFSLQAYENNPDRRLSRQMDELTRSMAYCNGRIATLKRQVAFLKQKQDEISAADA